MTKWLFLFIGIGIGLASAVNSNWQASVGGAIMVSAGIIVYRMHRDEHRRYAKVRHPSHVKTIR